MRPISCFLPFCHIFTAEEIFHAVLGKNICQTAIVNPPQTSSANWTTLAQDVLWRISACSVSKTQHVGCSASSLPLLHMKTRTSGGVQLNSLFIAGDKSFSMKTVRVQTTREHCQSSWNEGTQLESSQAHSTALPFGGQHGEVSLNPCSLWMRLVMLFPYSSRPVL